ncbi:cysteine hydrolase family protein [Clostridium autoethanogenum]|uniref:Cysteine hydrolase n=1 Tax=Clostridium autoethanogenum DSM 10061 TaxID=1341692 RepID=A0ABN4BBS1_9CLOT|nr:cysteine hydrolase family protein [Clostridium autoethanogenum]AGY74924.1 cysteine hydrolase [Clostridium autoethanogenum DSM 10061]ALU35098.1 Isochorismatase hydrolase [Clostridium autoethanogenum DSM 10061]OVY49402.1 Streptothricin hydrolase [Clostridium autoethanogenum]
MSKKTALLIIDVQVAMFAGEEGDLYNADRVLDNICTLLKRARSSKTSVIFIQHTDKDGEFQKGKDTWQLHPRLHPQENEKVIEKTTWESFYNTGLEEELKRQGIEKLIIAGMQTEFCLDTTCRRAFSMGYDNILVRDAHSTFDGEILSADQIIKHHNSVLGGRFVQLKSTDEVEF